MAKSVYVDQEECIGCGNCVDSCPDVFAMTDDSVAEVASNYSASEEEIQEAIDICPVECIHWEDQE